MVLPPSSTHHHHRATSLRQSNKKNKRFKASKRSVSRAAGGKAMVQVGVGVVNSTTSTPTATGCGVSGGGGSVPGDTWALVRSFSKASRKNQQAQRRDAKRQELLRIKRGGIIGTGTTATATTMVNDSTTTLHRGGSNSKVWSQPLSPPPRVVGIISLGAHNHREIEEHVRECLTQSADDTTTTAVSAAASPTMITCKYNVHKKQGGQLTFLTLQSSTLPAYANHRTRTDTITTGGPQEPASEAAFTTSTTSNSSEVVVAAALDLARVCDVLLLVMDSNGPRPAREITEIQCVVGNGNGSNGSHSRTPIHPNSNSKSTATGQDSFDSLISPRGDQILAALKGQGLPTPVTVLAHTAPSDHHHHHNNDHDHDHNSSNVMEGLDDDDDNDNECSMTLRSVKSLRRATMKRKLDLKKYVSRFATTEFGSGQDRVVELDLTLTQHNNNRHKMETTHDDDETTSSAEAKSKREASSSLPSLSLLSFSSSSAAAASARALVRTLCHMRCRPPQWVSQSPPRSYLLADTVQYDVTTQQLQLTGYLRGRAPLHIHALMHIPQKIGTVVMDSITAATASSRSHSVVHRSLTSTDKDNDDEFVLRASNEDERESLHMFATPHALDGEQNLVGFDETETTTMGDCESDHENNNINNNNNNNDDGSDEDPLDQVEEQPVQRPTGWSEYHSAWFDVMLDNKASKDDNDNDDESLDRGELAHELNQKPTPILPPHSENNIMTMTSDGRTTMMDMDTVDWEDTHQEDFGNGKKADKKAFLDQRKKDLKDNLAFPDEVQLEEDQVASERFARYRSLKSFRKSFWDPKENLPATYSSIYHFTNFRATQRSVLNECTRRIRVAQQVGDFWGGTPSPPVVDATRMDLDRGGENSAGAVDVLDGCVPTGAYVTITFRNVTTAPAENALMVAVSLLPHENKMSVLHLAVSRQNDAHGKSALVKSKDVVTFRCGWRTWQGRPIFSQLNLNSEKDLYERFLPVFGGVSVFGPVTYSPSPVLMFVGGEIVAMGSVIGADADRRILKRVILTGYPVKVHKRSAVVKYMFYNPRDVQWFKPASLYTKHGLQGNIVSSVGEHGTMKCLFHAPIKQHDTVCLPLYKRVYPKYIEQNDATEIGRSNKSSSGTRYTLKVL